jgi:hypothetical protein
MARSCTLETSVSRHARLLSSRSTSSTGTSIYTSSSTVNTETPVPTVSISPLVTSGDNNSVGQVDWPRLDLTDISVWKMQNPLIRNTPESICRPTRSLRSWFRSTEPFYSF